MAGSRKHSARRSCAAGQLAWSENPLSGFVRTLCKELLNALVRGYIESSCRRFSSSSRSSAVYSTGHRGRTTWAASARGPGAGLARRSSAPRKAFVVVPRVRAGPEVEFGHDVERQEDGGRCDQAPVVRDRRGVDESEGEVLQQRFDRRAVHGGGVHLLRVGVAFDGAQTELFQRGVELLVHGRVHVAIRRVGVKQSLAEDSTVRRMQRQACEITSRSPQTASGRSREPSFSGR
mmetsp:Transcript_60136/g.158888  ORF Transcript_60136/g.158888 Transcript_60136/m.158888 type:complete len:234 (+) Transcript_60136:38-739(+)